MAQLYFQAYLNDIANFSTLVEGIIDLIKLVSLSVKVSLIEHGDYLISDSILSILHPVVAV